VTVYRITRGFKTRTERSNRVLEIAETFGLGLAEKTFWVFRELDVEVRKGEVVYITGQSGSGKSLLLRELSAQMVEQGLRVANIDEVVLDERPLIDQLGRNMNDAIELLSRAGINDAYLAVRKPSELSDGQRYRFRLAKLMQTEADVWACDEFGAVLDRVTARAVSFNTQKLARAKGVTLMVATTHTDLIEELGPDLIVEKRFQNRVELKRPNDKSEVS
jgi:uncharacterized protein